MDERAEIRRALDKYIYWNQLDPCKHHFYKILKFFRFELRVPKKFVMRFPLKLGETVKLIGPIGDDREVRVVETEEDVLLREGWGEFVDDHHLNEEDLLVFHYIGNSAFEVFLFDRTACEKDLRVIQDQLEIKPHFFKMMNKDFRSKLLIPRKLVMTFPEKLVGTISLKGPSGNVWEVRADWGHSDDAFLRKGWSEFVSDHSLDEFDLLVFRYTGYSSFNVLVFDGSGCEKESSHFVKPQPKKVQQTNDDIPGGSRATDYRREFHIAEKQCKANPKKKKGKLGVQDYESDVDANETWRRRPKEVTQAELSAIKLKRSKKMATKKKIF